jgi:hypothetical protein
LCYTNAIMRWVVSKTHKHTGVIVLESEIDQLVLDELLSMDCLRQIATERGERIVITTKGRGVLKVLEQQLKAKDSRAG